MKILWLHQYFATPRGWGAVRTHAFARRFVQAGHAVDVVCGAGYDASLRSTGHEPAVLDGVRVFVSGTAYRPHMGFLRRVWSFLCFMAYALGFVVRRGGAYDVMIASSGPLTLAVPALIGRWSRGLPFVFEVIDVWPDSAIAAGVLKNPVLKWLSFRLEALAYKYASAIVTCSAGMTERVEKKLGEGKCKNAGMSECLNEGGSNAAGAAGSIGLATSFNRPGGLVQGEEDISHGGMARIEERGWDGERGVARKKRVVTISNCCDLGEFVPDGARREESRARYGVREDQTVVLYTGAMGLSNAVGDLVEAVRGTAGDERIVWWFAGGGAEAGKLMEFSRQDAKAQRNRAASLAEWQNGRMENPANPLIHQSANPLQRFFGSLPKVELIDLYLAADVNVVTFMHAPLFYENSPNKFFDGIAAGLPEVFNRSTWLEPWLEEYDCGVVCEGTAPGKGMAEAIRKLADHPERRKQMGRSARRLAEEVFDRDKLAAEYLSVLKNSINIPLSQ